MLLTPVGMLYVARVGDVSVDDWGGSWTGILDGRGPVGLDIGW